MILIDSDGQDLLFRRAHTPTGFTPGPVEETTVRAVHELVKWGPTAFNTQPLRVLLVRSPQARQRLAGHLAEGNRDKTLNAPLTAVLAAYLDFHLDLPALFPQLPEAKDWFGDEQVREQAARLNATLQIGYLILGIRAAGLAVGPMTGFDPAGVDRELFPDGRHRSLVITNIGHPSPGAWGARNPRLDFGQVFTTV